MIKRLLRWTPDNLPSAFFVATFLSSCLILAFAMVSIALLEGSTGVDTFGKAALVLGVLVFWVIPVWVVVAIGLAIFGVLPTIWLRTAVDKRWMWLVALVAGAAAGPTWYWLFLMLTSGRTMGIADGAIFCASSGALTGLIWWALARRVIKRDWASGRELGES